MSDQALAPLAALHGTLQELSLLEDAQYSVGFKLTGAGWAVVNHLTGLQSLDLSGTTWADAVLVPMAVGVHQV